MKLSKLAGTPYYAVIFTSLRTEGDNGYGAMAEAMERLGSEQAGFLGIDSARNTGAGGVGITVSYWRDLESIRAWKANLDHLEAQARGKQEWYAEYSVRVCRVEYEYGMGGEARQEAPGGRSQPEVKRVLEP